MGSKPTLDMVSMELAACSPISGLAFHHDYLHGFTNQRNYRPLLAYLGKMLKHEFGVEEQLYRQHQHLYPHVARTTNGASMRWYWDEEKENYVVRVEIPGKPMSAIGFVDQMRMLYTLRHGYKFRCTRIDPCLDDHKKRIKANWLKKAIDNEDYTGFKKHNQLVNGEKGKEHKYGWQLGSNDSDNKLTIYETLAKHKDIDAHRYEIRLRNDHAQSYFELVTETCMPWFSEDSFGENAIQKQFDECAQKLATFRFLKVWILE